MKRSINLLLVLAIALTSVSAFAQYGPKAVKTKPAVKSGAHKSNWFSRMFTAPHRRHQTSVKKAKPVNPAKAG
jgi:hypothetical protein